MHLGVVFPNFSNSVYRAIGPAQALERRGHRITLVHEREDGGLDSGALMRSDVVHIYRCCTPGRRHDRRRAPATRRFRAQMKLCRAADVVTTTSGSLAATLEISKVLGRLLERHRAVRIVTVGVRLDLESARYEHRTPIPMTELKECLRRFDVGIAPIADVPMSYARSNVKVKEYAAAGVPWLASARGPYVGLGARQGGLLVEDDGWDQALDRLVTSRYQRWKLGRRATTWAKSQALDRHVAQWEEVFEEARARAADRGSRSAEQVRA